MKIFLYLSIVILISSCQLDNSKKTIDNETQEVNNIDTLQFDNLKELIDSLEQNLIVGHTVNQIQYFGEPERLGEMNNLFIEYQNQNGLIKGLLERKGEFGYEYENKILNELETKFPELVLDKTHKKTLNERILELELAMINRVINSRIKSFR